MNKRTNCSYVSTVNITSILSYFEFGGFYMAKGFTEEEKTIIKEQLLEKAKEVFSKYGFKKTGIRELTSAVGVANGTFYQFFSSKEELFFTILQQESDKIRRKIFDETLVYKDEPVKALKSLFYSIIEELENNPMMKTILLQEEVDLITRKLTPDQIKMQRESSLIPLTAIAQEWKKKGWIQDVKPEIFISSIRSLIFLWFHKSEIGDGVFDQVIEFLLDRACTVIKK